MSIKIRTSKSIHFNYLIEDNFLDNAQLIILNLNAGVLGDKFSLRKFKTPLIKALDEYLKNKPSKIYISLFGLASLCFKTKMLYNSKDCSCLIESIVSDIKRTIEVVSKFTLRYDIPIIFVNDVMKTPLEVGIRPYKTLIGKIKDSEEQIAYIVEPVMSFLELIGYSKVQLANMYNESVDLINLLPPEIIKYLPSEIDRRNLEAYTKLEKFLC